MQLELSTFSIAKGLSSSHGSMSPCYCTGTGSLVPRPIPSFSMLHAVFQRATLKTGNGPGDEARHRRAACGQEILLSQLFGLVGCEYD